MTAATLTYAEARPFWHFLVVLAGLLILLACSIGALRDAHRYARSTR